VRHPLSAPAGSFYRLGIWFGVVDVAATALMLQADFSAGIARPLLGAMVFIVQAAGAASFFRPWDQAAFAIGRETFLVRGRGWWTLPSGFLGAISEYFPLALPLNFPPTANDEVTAAVLVTLSTFFVFLSGRALCRSALVVSPESISMYRGRELRWSTKWEHVYALWAGLVGVRSKDRVITVKSSEGEGMQISRDLDLTGPSFHKAMKALYAEAAARRGIGLQGDFERLSPPEDPFPRN